MVSFGRAITVPSGADYSGLGTQLKSDELETRGSLLLVEPGHPVFPWAAGVPVSGSAMPNAVDTSARAILGSSTAPVFTFQGLNGVSGKVERTSKGALHGIVSPIATTPGSATIELPPALMAYLIANPTHSYYYSLWDRQTRLGADPQPQRLIVGQADSIKQHMSAYKSGMRPSAGWGTRINAANETASALGTGRHAISVNGWYSSTPATNDPIEGRVKWGGIGYFNSGAAGSNLPSFAFYRLYIEDLTVSGRTHAQVSALDDAMFTNAFALGGRYANDVIAPVPSAVSPSAATSGSTMTITGTGFTGVTAVNIGGLPATNVTVVSDTQVTCTVPSGSAGTASIVMQAGSRSSDSFPYTRG